MSVLNNIPSWVGAGIFTIFGVIMGGLGYFIRLGIEGRQKREDAEKTHLLRLEDLAKLLKNSDNIFRTQNAKVVELRNLVLQNHPGEVPADVKGYDDTFHYMYMNNKYTPNELSLHNLIRSVTFGSMYQTNQGLQDWFRSDYSFLSRSEEH